VSSWEYNGPDYRRRHHDDQDSDKISASGTASRLELPPVIPQGAADPGGGGHEAIHGPDPRTPEEFARDYQVPLEAVLEALDYVAQNRPLIELERDREAAKLRARGFDGPAQG